MAYFNNRPGKRTSKEVRVEILKKHKTVSASKYTISGRVRSDLAAPVTLPKLKCLEPDNDVD